MAEKKIRVAICGYFDPLHIGHLDYMKLAKALGDELIVIVNNDKQAIRKKGFVFMPLNERIELLKSIKWVDKVVESIDDSESVYKTLEIVKPDIFAKGGDRNRDNIPKEEIEVCKRLGIKFMDGIGRKIQSSSALLESWSTGKNQNI